MPGSAPGERRGGRRKGALNKATIERRIRAETGMQSAIATGVPPLDVILKRMRDPDSVSDRQFEAAVAAAPYVHARLSSALIKIEDPFAGMTRDDIDELVATCGSTDTQH